MKPMLLSDTNEIPIAEDWVYETKYDGFRCIVDWTDKGVQLWSRNEKLLNKQFPEIIAYCESLHNVVASFAPLKFDGEIVYLQNEFSSDFSKVQMRGRMKNMESIEKHVKAFPCQLLLFDMLMDRGMDLTIIDYTARKKKLIEFFKSIQLSEEKDVLQLVPLQLVKSTKDGLKLWQSIRLHNGEGMVAKKNTSTYSSGKRVTYWLKLKNWRTVTVFVRTFDPSNGFFSGAVFKEKAIVEIVAFRHGLTDDEFGTLRTLFMTNGKLTKDKKWELPPSICVNVQCIGIFGQQLREPKFASFELHVEPTSCTWRKMLRELHPLPEQVMITHSNKPVWPETGLVKDDYLWYLQKIAPYLLPWLQNRLLTVIRYPHGVGDESFYQKNVPDYAPDFVSTHHNDGIDYIICNEVSSLLWLGNQLALEFHVPFQTINVTNPTEIVFDLDPPSVNEFPLAIEGALRLKQIFDEFQLRSFIKTSGGKGLQLYIPLSHGCCSYGETRIFTKFVCDSLCEQEPKWFTTERLKKNRNGKLYLDYVQHEAGKTIIAPYSPRGTHNATVATPLEWNEVNSSLRPDLFTVESIPERLEHKGDLFRECRATSNSRNFTDVLNRLKDLKHFR